MTGLKVGVTLSRISDDLTNLLWSAGIGQNCALLLMLLQRLPVVAQAVGVDCSGKPGPNPLAAWCGVPTLPPDEAAGELDVVIELGARQPTDAARRLKDRGGRIVSYMAGNSMAMNFEAVSSRLPHGEIMADLPFDAVWVTPQHWTMNRALCLLTRSDKVERCPHIWEPIFLESLARQSNCNPFFRRGRAGDGQPWRIGVLEPNINVLKTFHLPMLACEEAFRAAPDLIGQVMLFNTQHLIGVPHFDEITMGTDLGRSGRMTAEPRLPTAQLLGALIDAVVVHQWQNDMNYLFWDVLWTGHPLVHNAPSAQEVGYFYRSWDPADGGRALTDAMRRHAERAEAARREAVTYLWRYRIDNPDVQARHVELLEGVMA